MTSNSHPSINDRLLSPTKRIRLNMHPSTDASPDIAANEPHLTYEAASKIVKKLSPDMVENIFKFISGEEVMRTSDIARILSYLGLKEIMRARRVSKKWRDAAKMTVPTSEFVVNSVRSYNTMRVMTTALPYLQQLKIRGLGRGHKYIDGEDPYEEDTDEYTAHFINIIAAETADDISHDIDIISNFKRLQSLVIYDASLNGIYPVLSNFPLLQKLIICSDRSSDLKWNLDMLSGLPSLTELVVMQEHSDEELSGNLRGLRVLKDTLEKVDIYNCPNITGNFMDLADFPRLKDLDLSDTAVTGDIRDICGNHFPALENLRLPESVRGGIGYKFHSITEVPSFMHAIHRLLLRLLQRNPDLLEHDDWNDIWHAFRWSLSKQSPDWYQWESGCAEPPFNLKFIQAGSRFGWSWRTFYGANFCEINWLDPEPSIESDDYEAYIEDLQRIERQRIERELNTDFYRGYHEPPTEMEYHRLCEGLEQRD